MISAKKKRRIGILAMLLLSTFTLQACGVGELVLPPAQDTIEIIPLAPLEVAEITFRVTIPLDTPPDEAIQLSILDEVTGLAINPTKHDLEPAEEENTYTITIQVPNGTLLKYRYARQGELPALEHNADGRPVRYRMYQVNGSGLVYDIVHRWNDTEYDDEANPTGRIVGALTDAETGQPLPNIMIIAGGVQTLTAWDGSYLLEGLHPGVHNLVAYALDGKHLIFQQGARVAEFSSTPASFSLTPVPLVPVTFTVTVPGETIPGVPVRLAGNLHQLGNTYANLSGGMSVISTRLPAMTFQGDGKYQITIDLPAGAYIRYKYTLGDGFWNAEHTENGRFGLHQFTVPLEPLAIEDTVYSWSDGNRDPVWVEITVPPETPRDEFIALQLNPWGWTQPIPMWLLEENKWVYQIYSPLTFLDTVQYRYCRNGQCDAADDVETAGGANPEQVFSAIDAPPSITDSVSDWQWTAPFEGEIPALPESFTPRDDSFVRGVEFQADYHPSWGPLFPKTLRKTQTMASNTVLFTPTWSFTRLDPPVFEVIPGTDSPWLDTIDAIESAQILGLNTAIFPQPRFPTTAENWWVDAPRDENWWPGWFERYETFALHHAGMAASSGTQILILGGDWLDPALPDGFMADGFSSGVPGDAESRWREIIDGVRENFDGTVLWALPLTQGLQPPPFLDAVDGLYILWKAPLSAENGAGIGVLEAEAARLLDTQVWPLAFRLEKPLLIGASFLAVEDGYAGCMMGGEAPCDLANLNVGAQLDAYAALLQAVEARDWVGGFVTRDFYPPVPLGDPSASVHGKPAETLLQTWFEAWIGPE